MSSILTNTSSMVALQTLKGIGSNLAKTQAEISTGKAVGSAKDNAAVFAISKVMESDVKGFKGISDSLSLGESTVGVARLAAEKVTDLLTNIKGKIVASQEQNVDRGKIQTDIAALRSQIETVVGSAQFNGLNLVNGSVSGTNANGNTGINVLASLDRSSTGTVTASRIGVDAQNLSLSAGVALTAVAASVGTDAGTAGVIDASGTNDSITLGTFAFQGGGTALSSTDPAAVGANGAALLAGDRIALTIGSVQGVYTVKEGDTADSITSGVKNALQAGGINTSTFTLDVATSGALTITNNTNADVAFSFEATRNSGGLSSLATIDVTSNAGATAALGAIENLINTAIDASAEFGSAQGRIEIQSDFISQLSDSLKAGIGTLVDANLEEASARLQALQTQQQLGIQALSIANQAPQSILALFR
ncbi:MAG: flagellin [Paracoccaceae bacterium]|nr:flagellin [Paracoccaceae bacterium]